jgi:hypothetical protein
VLAITITTARAAATAAAKNVLLQYYIKIAKTKSN